MPALSEKVVTEFCGLCDAAFQAAQAHRILFDDNPAAASICASSLRRGYVRLSEITHEHALLQIAKLHDPVVMSGRVTLGIAYVLEYGGWPRPIEDELRRLRAELDGFAANLKEARNRTLAHNDLGAMLADGNLGAFDQDEDRAYFDTLECFADIVSREVTGEGFTYRDTYAESLTRVGQALASAADREASDRGLS